ncbi:MAG: glycosyltransferase family 2 protein [Gammaproteobacteria bacterium]
MNGYSIVLPARNEAANLDRLLPEIRRLHPQAELVVVDDGSNDHTVEVCAAHTARCIQHPYSMGNGAAIKTGARHAESDVLVFMDADGQHDPAAIGALLERLDQGYEMAVGARRWNTHASRGRRIANYVYNRLASYMAGQRIEDLTSGFRAVRRRHFLRFLYLLPNGFSYPTTVTMAFFRSALPVAYVPIEARRRGGRSHIRLLEDGLRFFVIILKVGTLFSPMRLFLPVSLVLFATGALYYLYTYINFHRFTNMSAVVILSAMLTFLIGILAELVSALHYKDADSERRLVRRTPAPRDAATQRADD